jgi:hypothetical protein
MSTYRCLEPDCKEVCEDGGVPEPLHFMVPQRTYRRDDPLLRRFAWPWPGEETKTFPAYSLKKCPWCRGNLIEIPKETQNGNENRQD